MDRCSTRLKRLGSRVSRLLPRPEEALCLGVPVYGGLCVRQHADLCMGKQVYEYACVVLAMKK